MPSDDRDDVLTVTLVIAPRFPLLSLAICTETLRVANRESGSTAFAWTTATVDGLPVVASNGLEFAPQAATRDIAETAVAIVLTAYQPEAACHPSLLSWLRRQDRQGGIIGCVDTAALVLGRAGLTQGECLAVHREALHAYRETLGEVVLLDRPHAFEGRRLSSAGGIATLDMILALIARTKGTELARQVAQVMNYARPEATESVTATATATALDARLGRLTALMQSHLEDPLPIKDLCRVAQVEESTARRLCRRTFGSSPGRYYMKLRLERARNLLRNSALTVSEIALAAGFADSPAFCHAFKRVYGLPPSWDREDPAGA